MFKKNSRSGPADHTGRQLPLNGDLRIAPLEALLPEDLERHIQMNRNRLVSFAKLRVDIVLCAEARVTSVNP